MSHPVFSRLVFCLAFFASQVLFAQKNREIDPRELAQQILFEMNLVRTDPQHYAQEVVKPLFSLYEGKIFKEPGQMNIITEEGVQPVEELYKFLTQTKPIGALALSRGLSLAAQAHAQEQGQSGSTGHQSANGRDPFERMEAYGRFVGTAGENISYGSKDARRIVLQLLIDDDVPSRGHRKNIMSPKFKVCGIGFWQHKKWRYVTVIDYATEFHTRR